MSRLGVGFSGGLTPSDIVECVVLAEKLGYESAWMAEGHGGDQFAVLAACAASTRRIRLGTSISSVFVRSAPTIGMAAATVDELSGGRFVLGLGSSHRVQVEPEHGIPFVQPTQRLRETIDLVRALLRDGAVSYAGAVVDIKRFDLWFSPLRREIPIYVSALFPPMLQIAGEIADGVLLTWPTLTAGRRATENVAIGARRAGRSADAIEVASSIPTQVSATEQEALDALRRPLAFYMGFFPRYRRVLSEAGFAEEAQKIAAAFQAGDHDEAIRRVPDEMVAAVTVAGTTDQCRAKLDAYRASGITLPVVRLRPTGPAPKRMAMETIRSCAPLGA